MAGYVLTRDVLNTAREVALRLLRAKDDNLAMNLRDALDHADGLDADHICEVAEWARDKAANSDLLAQLTTDAKRAKLAELAHIIELCDGILIALAESKLPPGAMRVVGRERLSEGGDLPVEPAANTFTREKFEALPSADRVVLGQILATLRGEPVTAKPHGGAAVDVLVELSVYLGKLARSIGVEQSTSAPALLDAAAEKASTTSAIPEDHPLRRYRWGDWLRYLIRVEELGAGSGYLAGDRLAALRDVLARVEALDVDGLRGVLARVHVDGDVHMLLRYAMGDDSHNSTIGFGVDGVSRCRHRVPAVERERGGAA